MVDLDCEAVLSKCTELRRMEFSETHECQRDVDVHTALEVYSGPSTWVPCDIDVDREGARHLGTSKRYVFLGVYNPPPPPSISLLFFFSPPSPSP